MALQLSDSQEMDGFSCCWLDTSDIRGTRTPGVCMEVNSTSDQLL